MISGPATKVDRFMPVTVESFDYDEHPGRKIFREVGEPDSTLICCVWGGGGGVWARPLVGSSEVLLRADSALGGGEGADRVICWLNPVSLLKLPRPFCGEGGMG